MPSKPPPHVSALASQYEQEPKKRAPRSWFPHGSVPYKVQDNENFEELALFSGWNAWDLIYYNFQTKDPREVNWYLRNYTGCKLPTWDNKNFRFSSDADPGIIFFPKWAYDNLIESGRKPVPIFTEDVEFHVPGPVPGRFQGFGPTCWGGAASAMILWKKRARGRPTAELLGEIAGKWKKRYEDNAGLDSEEMSKFTAACGLNARLLPGEATELGRLMRKHGPLMIIQDVSQAWNHWVVLTGYRVEPPVTYEVQIMDPGNSSRRYKDADAVLRSAKAVPGFWTRLYHW